MTADLRERIRRLPGMDRLLPALGGLPPAYLVGGAVRDLLRGAEAVDLDLAVEVDARSVGRTLADRLGGVVREHERFGTATVRAPDLSFDLATTRTEIYDQPGALPRVAAAPLSEDLRRRDFTVNAMAVALAGDDLGHLYDPHGGLADLEAGWVRILHPRSFLDDPTRLLRAIRYETRLGFRMDSDTERAARAAVAEGGVVDRVRRPGTGRADGPARPSTRRPPRWSACASSASIAASIRRSRRPRLVASASLGATAINADRALASLAALAVEAPAALGDWLDGLQLEARERDAVARAAAIAPRSRGGAAGPRAHALGAARPARRRASGSAGAGARAGRPVRADPALGDRSQRSPAGDRRGRPARRGGAGGTGAGRALEETLRRKLDGLVRGRDDELRTALELAR